MRTLLRRLSLCLGFSKKVENLKAAVSAYFAWHDLVHVHGSLKTTPAVAAGITSNVWTVSELLQAT